MSLPLALDMTRTALLSILALAFGPALLAQDLRFTVNGTVPSAMNHLYVRGGGDVNGDLVDDIVATTLAFGSGTSQVEVLSGIDGSVLHTWVSPNGPGFLSWGIEALLIDDGCGDGRADILIGGPSDPTPGGAIRRYSGATGVLMDEWSGVPADNWGQRLRSAGDFDGDGCEDWMHSFLSDSFDARIEVRSGTTGAILFALDSTAPLGTDIGCLGDVNNDGVADVFATTSNQKVEVFSGATGAVLWSEANATGNFGMNAFVWDDLDGDGVTDFVVDSNFEWFVYSGANGDLLGEVGPGQANEIRELVPAGDLDADGISDLLGIHVMWPDFSIVAYSSRDNSMLFLEPYVGSNHLIMIAVGSDVDGDGFPEFAVSTNSPNQSNLGSLRFHEGYSSVGSSYCGPANPNSTGQSGELTVHGRLNASLARVTLVARKLPPQRTVLFLASQQQNFVPLGQGNLCLGGPITRLKQPGLASDAQGIARRGVALHDDITIGQVTVGETWNFQAWHLDSPGTHNLTDAVSVVLQ